jgi:hypothetical protein
MAELRRTRKRIDEDGRFEGHPDGDEATDLLKNQGGSDSNGSGGSVNSFKKLAEGVAMPQTERDALVSDVNFGAPGAPTKLAAERQPAPAPAPAPELVTATSAAVLVASKAPGAERNADAPTSWLRPRRSSSRSQPGEVKQERSELARRATDESSRPRGATGVTWHSRDRVWCVRFWSNRSLHWGTYSSKENAMLALDVVSIKLGRPQYTAHLTPQERETTLRTAFANRNASDKDRRDWETLMSKAKPFLNDYAAEVATGPPANPDMLNEIERLFPRPNPHESLDGLASSAAPLHAQQVTAAQPAVREQAQQHLARQAQQGEVSLVRRAQRAPQPKPGPQLEDEQLHDLLAYHTSVLPSSSGEAGVLQGGFDGVDEQALRLPIVYGAAESAARDRDPLIFEYYAGESHETHESDPPITEESDEEFLLLGLDSRPL